MQRPVFIDHSFVDNNLPTQSLPERHTNQQYCQPAVPPDVIPTSRCDPLAGHHDPHAPFRQDTHAQHKKRTFPRQAPPARIDTEGRGVGRPCHTSNPHISRVPVFGAKIKLCGVTDQLLLQDYRPMKNRQHAPYQ